jgi:hypothetical protein
MSLFSFGLGAAKGEGGGGETIHIYPENELSFEKKDTAFSFVEDDYAVAHEETLEFSIEVIEDPENVMFEQQEVNIDVES